MWGLGIMRIGGRRDARTRGWGPRGHWGMWDIREREVGTQGLGGMGICGMWEGDGDTGMGGGQIWRQKHEDKGTGGQGGHGDTRMARHRNRRMRRGTGRQGTRGHRNRGIWEQEGVESPATLLLTGTWGALCCLLCGTGKAMIPMILWSAGSPILYHMKSVQLPAWVPCHGDTCVVLCSATVLLSTPCPLCPPHPPVPIPLYCSLLLLLSLSSRALPPQGPPLSLHGTVAMVWHCPCTMLCLGLCHQAVTPLCFRKTQRVENTEWSQPAPTQWQEENRDKSGSSAQSTPSNPVHVCSRYIFAALAAVVCKPTRYIASASSFWWLESPILACLSDIRKTVTFQCHILPVSTVDEGCAWTRGRGERGRTWWTSCCGDVWQGQPCL